MNWLDPGQYKMVIGRQVNMANYGQQKVGTTTVAAPMGGWNARDAIAAMGPLDAVTLTNFWPGTNSVIQRNGYTQHATGLPAQVETLMTYSAPSGTQQLFAISSGNIYNVTSSGAVGAAVVSGLSNSRWQYINITTAAGSYLILANGVDRIRYYDGTSWVTEGSGPPYDISGVSSNSCVSMTLFKNRVWLVQNNSLKAWYLAVNSIGGAATSLDMTSLFRQGGYIVAAMTWTLDAGYGMDDYLAFITSTGEVAVWRLTDPTTPSGIALIGIYVVGAPVGRRCSLKYGGDLLLITQDGVIPMSKALQSSRLDPRVSITDKIELAMSQAVTLYGSNFGWQLLLFSKENQLILNVPVQEGTSQQQYVQNNITNAWCNFTGWSANCWELLSDNPYFGGNTFVGRAWNTTTDNGADVPGLAIQSFQSYGGAVQKQIKLVRYHFYSDGQPSVYGNVNVDYDLSDQSAQLSTTALTYGSWDSGVWDTALWGSNLVPIANWQGASGIGYSFAPFLKTATQGIQLQWLATDLVFEAGGVL